jgi:glycosyltransferase involved in cell wall biosynthesis
MAVPRVSIIMNVRNGAATLREALGSVMAQTFTDWEIIFFDDHSTDESARIVAEYADDRIRYFHSQEDMPLGRARDVAIRHASGEWLAFLDQDDIWVPSKLHKQMLLVEGEPEVGIVYGRTLIFAARGRERDYDHRHEFQPLPEGDIFRRLFIDSCFISMSSALLRRSAFDEIGGIADEIQVIPDYYLFVAIARGHRVRAVQEVVCRYRLHAANMSQFSRRLMHEEALWLIGLWSHCLDPNIVARRRRLHHSMLALEEIRHIGTASGGIARLLTHGSLGFLFSRPFVLTFRAIRRRVRRPYYLRSC